MLYVRFFNSSFKYEWSHGYSGGLAAARLREIYSDGTVSVEMVPKWKYDEGEVPRSDGSFANAFMSEDYSYAYDWQYHRDRLNTSHKDVEMRRCQMQPNDAGRMLYPQVDLGP